MDGRLPTWRTVLAFARGAGADEGQAAAVWEAAARAVRPRPARARSPYVPGRFTTRAGLAEAMRRMRSAAGDPTLDELTAAGAGQFSRSALYNALTGRRLPSEQLLTGFAAAVGADGAAVQALLAGRARIVAEPRQPAVYPCDVVDRAEERRQQAEPARPWLAKLELDPYDQRLRDEEDAEFARWVAWIDSLTDAEFTAFEQQLPNLTGVEGLRAALVAYRARTADR
jgi:hypothetical protein